LFHVVYPCIVVMYYPPYGATRHFVRDQASATVMCHVMRAVEVSTSVASLLLEVHISLALTCQFFKWRKALPMLWRSVPFVWPVAFILGGLQVFVQRHKLQVDMKTGVCVSDTNSPIYAPVILLTYVICLSSNILAAMAAGRNAPHSVQRKTWRMAMCYPLNFAITSGCLAATSLFPSLWTNIIFRTWTGSTVSLNGFVNSLTYFYQSRFASSRRFRTSDGVEAQDDGMAHFSFNVNFAAGPDVRFFVATATSASVRSTTSCNVSSFSVADGRSEEKQHFKG